MWPWGHAAFGYVLYSLGCRAIARRPPTGAAVLALLFATQLPDLVDKPLAWGLGWFPQGYAVAHSVLVAIPVGFFVIGLGARFRRIDVGIGFAVGYWSHLAGDVLSPVLRGDAPSFERVLWPLITLPSYDSEYTLLERVNYYLSGFLESLSASEQAGVLLVYFGPFAAAFVLWLVDGAPGVGTVRRTVRKLI
ncbi:metal-dependent hydrolase [Halegenticoccus tardaugens]|uniref:metal-dependent hydrolase n=1 Tax=Halegenticoccus tardaugens TaxID=2071624 RepID=UPI00100B14ED|nr:metal-dependent hydrolase [Halegenticoccus tardaugens]